MGGQGRGLYRTWCVDCCLLDWRRYAPVGAAVDHWAPARGEAQWKNMWRWSCGRSKNGAVGWNQCGWWVTPHGPSESSQRGNAPRSSIHRTIKKKGSRSGRKENWAPVQTSRWVGRKEKGKSSGVQGKRRGPTAVTAGKGRATRTHRYGEKEREARWTGGAGAAAKRAVTTTRVEKDLKKRKGHSGRWKAAAAGTSDKT